MSYTIKLTEELPIGNDGQLCRILELRADTLSELQVLRLKARAKKWFDWIGPEQLGNGQWGLVMEKGMPDFDLDATVAQHTDASLIGASSLF